MRIALRRLAVCLIIFSVAFVPALHPIGNARAITPRFTVQPMSPGPGNTPLGINSLGQILDGTLGPRGFQLWLYTDSSWVEIRTPYGPTTGGGLNDRGWVSCTGGFQFTPDYRHACRTGGGLRDLGTLGGDTDSAGIGLNFPGAVVGISCNNPMDNCRSVRPFIWDEVGGMQRLFIAVDNAKPTGINDTGLIVGHGGSETNTRAFIFDPSREITIVLPVGQPLVNASGINGDGDVVGWASTPPDTLSSSRAFLYKYATSTMIQLPGLPGFPSTQAHGLNNHGQVVGAAWPSGGRAFLYGGGRIVDLNDLVDSTFFSRLTSAYRINDEGWIIGTGCHEPPAGNCGALYLARPIPVGTPIWNRAKGRNPCILTPQLISSLTVAAVAGTVMLIAAPSPWVKLAGGLVQSLAFIEGYVIVKNCLDPFDPDFGTVFQPQFQTLPAVPTDPCMPPGLIDEINQTFDHGGRAASYLQAMNVTINREQSAFTMGDDATVATQDAALNAYTNAAVDELNAYQAGLQDIGAIISGTSCDGLIGAGDVQSFLDNVRTSGVAALPQQEIDLFSLFGVDPATSIPWTVNVNASRVPLSLSDALRGMATVVGQIVAGYGGGNAPLRRR